MESAIIQENAPQLTLPKCKNEQLIFFNQIVKSPNELCSWLQFSNVCGVHIGIADIESFINKIKTTFIKGMKSKAGKKFDAYIVLKEDCITSFEFENKKKK
ncbi:topoisomerase C-terminal repeat-containing protein [Flavobacterium sp. NKUCC04_CG]|uniref:topoisomerase C-terminal repeat-containing protein n=1 Tax=Flavobacterium sp. NKUCC04_CG TaxID=2842121 RepID=UPI0021049948|nr:topoisomerase C-terminal repeat-containing protein [Flavobacterium sp. NKUCC04_CG]